MKYKNFKDIKDNIEKETKEAFAENCFFSSEYDEWLNQERIENDYTETNIYNKDK